MSTKKVPDGAESSEFISRVKLNSIIKARLKEKGISFFTESNEAIDPQDPYVTFKKELLQRHKHTIVFFWKYCFISMEKNFIKEFDQDLLRNSQYYDLLVIISMGFMQGIGALKSELIKNPKEEYIYSTMPTLFSEEELFMIIEELKKLLIEFPQKTIDCLNWIKEDVDPRNEQLAIVNETLDKVIVDNQFTKPEKKDEALLQKAIELLGAPGPHSLLWNQERKKVGILDPFEQFASDIDDILNYLDIVNYAWVSCNLDDDPKKLVFKIF